MKTRAESDEPHVLLNAFALTSMIPRDNSRLSDIDTGSSTSVEEVEVGMKTELEAFWKSSGFQEFGPVLNLPRQSLSSRQSRWGYSGNSSWLESIQLPIGTLTITLRKESRITSWLNIFTPRQAYTFANLAHLVINEDRTGSIITHFGFY